ncbi:MAG: hypothetical protein E3J46_11130, partial [Desulfobacteraceae bacterium]
MKTYNTCHLNRWSSTFRLLRMVLGSVKSVKYISIVALFFILMVVLITALSPRPILAQEETIELKPIYPKVESTTHEAIFTFPVSLIYRGDQARDFDLKASGPSGWNTYVTSRYERITISVIRLEPNKYPPEQVKVIATPSPSVIPEIGDYKITLVVSSGTIRDSIELTAVVTPTYSLDLIPSDRYYREATANRDNQFSLTVKNTGSGELTNIRFSAEKPQGWIVEFEPAKIDRLAAGISHEIQVNVKPASRTDRRYHEMTLIAEADQTRQTTIMNIRVEEPKGFWMWIGGAIALLVIGAFTFIFL